MSKNKAFSQDNLLINQNIYFQQLLLLQFFYTKPPADSDDDLRQKQL